MSGMVHGRYDTRSVRRRKIRAERCRQTDGRFAIVTVIAIVMLTCFYHFGLSTQADEIAGPEETASKYYTSVMITYEMDASDYAREYADPAYYRSEKEYLREVCRINHIGIADIDFVGPGNYIIIPYYQ